MRSIIINSRPPTTIHVNRPTLLPDLADGAHAIVARLAAVSPEIDAATLHRLAELGFIAVNQDFVAANEDAVVRFMAGYLKAARLLDNGGWNDDAVLDIVVKYTGTDPDTLRGIPYTVRSEDGAIDMASVREQEAFFRSRGDLEYEGDANIDAVYRVDLLKRANDLLAGNQ